MGTAERNARNQEIVTAKMRGMTLSQIGEAYDLSKAGVSKILKEYRESEKSLRKNDPLEIADELLDGYQADISELVLIGIDTDNDGVRVAAVNSRMSARQRITELLQALGILPNDLGELRIEIDARIVAERVMAVLDANKIPQKVRDDLMRALEGEIVVEADELVGLPAGS